jgi:hypothetical protein
MKFLPTCWGGPDFQLTFQEFVMVKKWQTDSSLLL